MGKLYEDAMKLYNDNQFRAFLESTEAMLNEDNQENEEKD